MEPNFVQNTFVQAVVQDKRTNKILRISTINETAYKKMQDEKVAFFIKLQPTIRNIKSKS